MPCGRSFDLLCYSRRQVVAKKSMGAAHVTSDSLPLAASVLLLRPGVSAAIPFEVYMLRRPTTTRFAPGAYIFPGGILDHADRVSAARLFLPEAMAALNRQTARMAASGYFVADDRDTAAALLVCAARELFEESGILMTRARSGAAPVHPPPELDNHRALLLNGAIGFGDLCEQWGLYIEPEDFVYFSHWITPSAMKLRYDTHFFLAALPARQDATHYPGEMDLGLWITPAEALRRHTAGEFPMVPVQTQHLERLEAFASLAELLDFGRTKQVRAVLAEIVDRSVLIPDGVRACW